MSKDELNKIIKGFEFNVGWFVQICNLAVTIENSSLPAKDSPEFKELIKPLHMLINDGISLCHEQGVNILEQE